ncbi:MAG: hypothetical protein M9949_05125 [Candidatus Kapabacteria bacterium]|nr:hypothetical protein [Candidatus Kapabacteria bacterium]
MFDKRDLKLIGKIFASIIIFYLIFAIIVVIFHKDKENPTERNYIIFRHDSIENVRDSLQSMQLLMKEMFSTLPRLKNTFVDISTADSILQINERRIGKLDLEILTNDSYFMNFDIETMKRFVFLFQYLNKNDITSFSYDTYYDFLICDYKEYYDMYKTFHYDDDLSRFLILKHPSHEYLQLYKIIDSKSGLYLLSFKSAKIWGDSIPYMKYEDRELD